MKTKTDKENLQEENAASSPAPKMQPMKNDMPPPPNVDPNAGKEILHFEVSTEGVKKIAETIGAVVPNQYVRQVLVTALNANIKPVFE